MEVPHYRLLGSVIGLIAIGVSVVTVKEHGAIAVAMTYAVSSIMSLIMTHAVVRWVLKVKIQYPFAVLVRLLLVNVIAAAGAWFVFTLNLPTVSAISVAALLFSAIYIVATLIIRPIHHYDLSILLAVVRAKRS